MLRPLELQDRLILVTGASSGIGRATAQHLDALGARVLLGGRREAQLEETRASLTARNHVVAQFDLCQTDAIGEWLGGLCRAAGSPLHGVVHCAGIGPRVPLRALARTDMERVLEIHLYAALALLKAASARANLPPAGSSIVLLSSVAAQTANPGLIVYGAAKAALHAVARTASVELAPKRVRVNCLAPAYVETPMLASAREGLPGDFSALEKRQWLGWISPDEVAMAAGYLLSDAARSITGTTLTMDGGYTL